MDLLNSSSDGYSVQDASVYQDQNSDRLQYNSSKVPMSLMTPNSNYSVFENAGIYHNQILNTLIQCEGGIHYVTLTSIPDQFGRDIVNAVMAGEQKQIFPIGSTAIMQGVMNNFSNAKDLQSCINIFKSAFDRCRVNTSYANTSLVSLLSIAYYSSMYWSSAVVTDEYSVVNGSNHIYNQGPGSNPHPQYLPKWLNNLINWFNGNKKVISADIMGFATGVSIGAISGPWAIAAGVGLGAIGSWGESAPLNPNHNGNNAYSLYQNAYQIIAP